MPSLKDTIVENQDYSSPKDTHTHIIPHAQHNLQVLTIDYYNEHYFINTGTIYEIYKYTSLKAALLSIKLLIGPSSQ